MADPGWYPDPSGTPQRLRYWDGTSWSGRTTFDAERPTPKQRTATKTKGGRVPLIWLAGLVLLILIGVATVLIRQDPDGEPDIWSTSLTDSPLGQISNLF